MAWWERNFGETTGPANTRKMDCAVPTTDHTSAGTHQEPTAETIDTSIASHWHVLKALDTSFVQSRVTVALPCDIKRRRELRKAVRVSRCANPTSGKEQFTDRLAVSSTPPRSLAAEATWDMVKAEDELMVRSKRRYHFDLSNPSSNLMLAPSTTALASIYGRHKSGKLAASSAKRRKSVREEELLDALGHLNLKNGSACTALTVWSPNVVATGEPPSARKQTNRVYEHPQCLSISVAELEERFARFTYVF